jgi:hypothetical protein
MNANLLMSFGRMFPDFSHPVLVERADAAAPTAGTSPEPTNPNASFAEVKSFVGEFYASIEARTSSRSFPRLGSSGLMERGHFLTLNGLALHSADSAFSVCSLSEVLEPHVAPKYFLSARAAQGILRRAEKRGKTLPELLEAALRSVAQEQARTQADCPQTSLPALNDAAASDGVSQTE